jgi:VanZ family protein
MQTRRILAFTAWAFLAFIAFATLAPYAIRPELTETEPDLVVMIEHVGAFGLLGLLFLISYPERIRSVCLLVFGSAIALELAQALLPDRHARFADALEKVVGGGAGILLAIALLPVLMAPRELLARLDQQWFGLSQKTVDREMAELVIGFLVILLFAVTLVILQNLDW